MFLSLFTIFLINGTLRYQTTYTSCLFARKLCYGGGVVSSVGLWVNRLVLDRVNVSLSVVST